MSPTNVYKNGVFVGNFESRSHVSNRLKISRRTVCYYVNTGKATQSGYVIWDAFKDPNINREKPVINPDDINQRVAMFDRETKQILGMFKTVTQCANALQRPVKTVLSWLKGARCTDPDCYYKYEKDCTEREINNQYKI